jgi:hypothetical protein
LLNLSPKVQRHRVDAVAQPGGFRAVVEDVPQVRVAAAAGDGGALHAEAAVGRFDDILRRDRFPEAGPAGVRFELGRRGKQRRVAADAAEQSVVVQIPVLAFTTFATRSGACTRPSAETGTIQAQASSPSAPALSAANGRRTR